MAEFADKPEPGDQLGIFAKYWQPGHVKTRLAASVGEAAAAELCRGFLAALTRRLGDVPARRIVAYTPPGRAAAFSELVGRRWSLVAQSEGDLGTRMRRFFAGCFAAGAEHVVLIGSDSPTVPPEYIEKAFQDLRRHPVVLGPTTDGGYYLVGASGRVPPIFEGVPWSGPDVWQHTVALLDRAKTPFAQLPAWYDVDDVDDLRRLQRDLKCGVDKAPAWSDLAETVQRALRRL